MDARLMSAPAQQARSLPRGLGSECPRMVVVPAGDYMRGSLDTAAGREGDESPRHKLTIPEPFGVGVYEVTHRKFARYRQGGYCWPEPGDSC